MHVIYRKIRHARYIYTKRNVEKVWGARYTLGARYLSKNTVVPFCLLINSLVIAFWNPKRVFCNIKIQVMLDVLNSLVVVLWCSVYFMCHVVEILRTHLTTSWALENCIRWVPAGISAFDSVLCKGCRMFRMNSGLVPLRKKHRAPILYNNYRLLLFAASHQRLWAGDWVVYVHSTNEPTGSGSRLLSERNTDPMFSYSQ